ncbi:hypothetical protein X927_05090 [Petrotoga mexicana DSM 14811]|jgi:hypothetical protein|uniref:Putative regulatory protein Pmob_0099 n=6 Tax=Petrotoga TaxID=28236 RepID=Y099_PETMO|nr:MULTISPECIES: DUF370 domain-containing protein [Petrotoga]A9BEX0.1 RecName: Full=Putative regulatory protein Pmob_0099 [Petrotoga mobilis SJ95]KUK15939.1 MAG: hypothetical protein XD53_0640 [Petrotoga mobilis]MDY6895019.1 DUF370 domain-containing protein [Thermotogota bacterium]HBT50950.1 DUF370 domain-containing protein [Petrotoga sp.]ABX30848.1 protein of unknown function DUF370 [Petrotoga mobilis SJ95]MBL5982165.1 hypothetical protein [Petrotoga sp. 8T1HF07.NaAc.6.1]
MYGLINIGFGNIVVGDRVIAIVSPTSQPLKRLKEIAEQQGKLLEVNHGRKTRAFIITDSGHVIASAIQPETITNRFLQNYYDIEKVLDKIRKEVL